MPVIRKIFRIVQYISLVVFLFLLFKLFTNSFKYNQLKIFLLAATAFIGSFLFLMLSENYQERKKKQLLHLAAYLLIIVVLIFNLILFEIIEPAKWQKHLLLILPAVLFLATYNQLKIHARVEKSILKLINNVLLIINFLLLTLFTLAIKIPVFIILMLLALNFILSVAIMFKKQNTVNGSPDNKIN
jgi:hypothetical protein